MTSRRISRTGPERLVRAFFHVTGAAATAALFPIAPAASAPPHQQLRQDQRQEVADFYASRQGRLLWFRQAGQQADLLFELLNTAAIDGLDRRRYRVTSLDRAIRAARTGRPEAARRADLLLSQALVDYVQDLRRPGPDIGIIYVDPELRPKPPSPRAILAEAAAAPSLEGHIATMGWMHPLYGQIRTGLMTGRNLPRDHYQRLQLSLERARELPPARVRHVLVNIPAQQLFMYHDGEVADSMRVVVGKPKYPTPMMSAIIRYAALNPYWNVPADLAAERVAPNVLKSGLSYLRTQGYQLLAPSATGYEVIDPATVDWAAVANGTSQVYLRQLPGPANAMGRMKFMFPNAQGVYLHDTPDRKLLNEASRLFSGGCVRLEHAPKLGQWLFGSPLRPDGAGPEQKVPLNNPTPVYLTYLTAVPSGSDFAFYDDIYGRDAARLAQLGNDKGTIASR